MTIRKILASEMTGAEVQFISLVHTGANGAPLKRMKSTEGGDVIKSEKFRNALKSGPEQPQLVAVVVGDEGNIEAAQSICKAAGIEIAETREAEGWTLLLPNADSKVNLADGSNQVLVRLGEELGAVCRVSKQFMPFQGTTSFAENMKTQGFFPQLRGALEVFGDTAFEIMSESDSPKGAKDMLKQAGEEFVSFIESIAAALPKSVFKLDEVVQALAVEPEVTAKTETPEPTYKATDAEGKEVEVTIEKAEDGTTVLKAGAINVNISMADSSPGARGVIPSSSEAEFNSADGVDSQGPGPSNQRKSEDDATAQADSADDANAEDNESEADKGTELSEVLKAIQGLGERLDATDKRIDEMGDTASEAAERSKNAEARMRGKVAGDAGGDNGSPEAAPATSTGGPPLMDTGITRKASWAS